MHMKQSISLPFNKIEFEARSAEAAHILKLPALLVFELAHVYTLRPARFETGNSDLVVHPLVFN